MDHTTLFDVLYITFRIEGKALEWFDSYLKPRYCKINVGGSYSDPRELAYSVPQGSCAGLVLYSVYASTIQEVVPQEQLDCHSYHDDHGLKKPFRPGTTEENNTISTLQNTTSDIKEWMDSNHLKMNSSKTEYIIYGMHINCWPSVCLTQ